MLRLVVDTSIQGALLALLDIDTKKVQWHFSMLDNRSSSMLLSNILKEGLVSISKNIDDIKEIVVSVGPGSFTGIKVGIAFCYGVKVGLNKDHDILIQGISSLKLVYKSLISQYGKDLYLFLPSTKNLGFIVKEDKVSNFDMSKKEGIELLQSLSQDSKIVVIDEWKALEENLEQKDKNIEVVKIDIPKVHDICLKELSLVEIVDKKGKNQYSVVEPLYCREPSVFGK